ncbi:Gfo/Idh/MocA family protein [Cryptosporangium aurantiacum]|uniref:Predicted dehydrogenase n=1 Tax=Cryptosporangium aurantiacum TaxID=134849 RepID=A0A1M7RMP8_9ACTN|nr:Gfo/Idh/MocA family oxidoreductase [Cryptosporangium aurantiacum]SHN47583.1 Predicted dehydrogenase [Cryptosporangium aurantiacum]
MRTSRYRVGFVGAGGVATRHAAVLSEFPDVSIVGVVDPNPDAARTLAEQAGATVEQSVDDLLAREVDAVYVCVPPFAHGPAEAAVLAAGVPLFVEKPLGLDVELPAELAAQVVAADVVTGVGFHWRYSAALERAREALAGRPVSLVAGTWLDKVPPVGWWPRRDGSGGQLIEQAVHVVDLARVLVGEVVEVYAAADASPPNAPGADVDSSAAATLRFASGAVGTLSTTCRLGWKHRAALELYADGVAVAVSEDGCEVRTADGTEWFPVDPMDAKRAVDRAFLDAVGGDRSGVLVDYVDALRSHQLACALATSVAERRPVELVHADV